MWIVREVPFDLYKVARGDQFIAIRCGTSMDLEDGPGPETHGFLSHIDLGIDTLHFLDQGILQQSIIEPISPLLLKDLGNGRVPQP